MRKQRPSGPIIFSPTDLCTFFESEFASWMDRSACEGGIARPPPSVELGLGHFAKLGDDHEARTLQRYRDSGVDVVDLSKSYDDFEAAFEATLHAIRSGADVVYQAALRRGDFQGYADFLVRIDRPSKLGDFSYGVVDSKLARTPKPYFLLQLCAYAEMLEASQGMLPEYVTVIGGSGEETHFRTDDFYFYYSALKTNFLEFQAAFDPSRPPVPNASDGHGRWQELADLELERLDHPSRVAGITANQVKRLGASDVTTMAQLMVTTIPRVPMMDDGVFQRLKAQARLQIDSTGLQTPKFQVLPHVAGERRGLQLLPPASPFDLYFDMEGYPLLEGRLEYVFGASYFEGDRLAYRDFWAHDAVEEKRAFEAFIDFAWDRFQQDRSMHIFHYANYEVTALRYLMGHHATREQEVDDLLRNEVFVDLYRVVKQGVQVGTPSYSLKSVERLYRSKRVEEIADAGQSIIQYARWCASHEGRTPATSTILAGLSSYNRADCESTAELAEWLWVRQREGDTAWVAPPPYAPSKDADEPVSAGRSDELLSRKLLAGVPEERSDDPERWRIHELLAHLVMFHRREDKPVWWAMFDRLAMIEEQLIEDGDCLGGLVRSETAPEKIKRSWAYEYRFDPDQDTKIEAGDSCFIVSSRAGITVERMDREAGTIWLKWGMAKAAPPDRLSLIPDQRVGAETLAASLRRTATTWSETAALTPAIRDLLRRSPPKIRGRARGSRVLGTTDEPSDATVEVIAKLDGTTLAIQGPPGAGKSFTASRAIVELLGRGDRVGITSNSHEAIDELMKTVLDEATRRGTSFATAKVMSGDRTSSLPESVHRKDKTQLIHEGPARDQLVGGTAWAFSHPTAAERFDYLFVDEAGQVSLANLIAMAPSAKNLVLVGDQRQLSQPIKGAHPGESGRSALGYLLQDHATIPDKLGAFLANTRRLHPKICSFISGAIYENRLRPAPVTSERFVKVPANARRIHTEAGLVWVPVEHEGNQRASKEEVEVIGELVAELLGRTIADPTKGPRKLTLEDIAIVAPYNMQVRSLKAALPGARIGTVDKFQGQQAAVVIVSMCASSAEGSARGMEFLFSPNRLNVAISRAQCLAVVVGSPALTRARAKSVTQMKLANLFCRIASYAVESSA